MKMAKSIQIQGRNVSRNDPSFIIAEVAQTHDGSLGFAHAFIDAAAYCGVDAIKFQTHIAHAESTARDQWRVKFSYKDATRFDYWKRMEFSQEEWIGLKKHADQKGLVFLSTPFSNEAAELLEKIDVSCWKVGSGEVENEILLNFLIQTKKPILLSTGMSSYTEIQLLYERFKKAQNPFALLHCTSEYPVPLENVGLNVIDEFLERFDCPIGFSSHFPSWYPSFAAIVRGASIVEHHITMSPQMFGPDVSASLSCEEFRSFVQAIREVEKILKIPLNKDEVARKLEPTRKLFSKSIVAAKTLLAGKKIELSDLSFKKPGDGLPVSQYSNLLGKTLVKNKSADDLILLDDIQS